MLDIEKIDNLGPMIKKNVSMRELNTIIFTNEENKDIEYEIIATFKNKPNKKIYYIMTDHTRTNDKLNVTFYYINYDENKDESEVNDTFYPVIDDDEFKMVNDVFKQIQSNV